MSSNDSPVTLDEAIEEENIEQDEQDHPEELYARLQTDPDFTVEDIEERFDDVDSFLQTLPEGFNKDEQVDPPTRRNPTERTEVVAEVDIPGFENLQQILSGVGDTLDDIGDINESIDVDLGELGVRGLQVVQAQALRSIAMSMQTQTQLTLQQSKTQVDQLSALYDILSSVEPIIGITVSGRNSIDDAGVPQPVVPESDNTEIPTRKLMVRASQTNSETISFGDDDTDPQNGFLLNPGQYITVPIDLREATLYMASEEEDDEVQLLGAI